MCFSKSPDFLWEWLRKANFEIFELKYFYVNNFKESLVKNSDIMGGWNEMRISQWDIKLGCRKAEDRRVYSVELDNSLCPVARTGSDPLGSLETSSAECPLLQSLGLQPSWLCKLLQKNGFAEPTDRQQNERTDHWVMWALRALWQEYTETIGEDKCVDVYECFGCMYDVYMCTICMLGA